MIKPDYESGSIVNLMASIARALEVKDTLYNPLATLNSQEIARHQNIILIVIDGLGYEFLQRNRKNSFIAQFIKQSLTSVFPSTTASAITAYATGLPVQQHAVSGWHMYFREINNVMAVLPFKPRVDSGEQFSYQEMQRIVDIPEPLMNKVQREKHVFSPRYIVDSYYSRNIHGEASRHGYATLEDCFKQIRQCCEQNKNRKYIYAYWPDFDSICHTLGVDHADTLNLFDRLDKSFEGFIKSMQSVDYQIIMTADHGLINSGESRTIILNDYPEILECLDKPLCGEPRVAYCYVKADKENQFVDLVRRQLGQFCDIYKTCELIEQNYFGLYDFNPKLPNRTGDYVLVMKENYGIHDNLPDESGFVQEAVHGGMSPEEMLVPLILLENDNQQ